MPENKSADRYLTVAGVASSLAQHASSYGIDIFPICRAIGIDPEDFKDVTKQVRLDRLCRLYEACAVIANDEAFALKSVRTYKAGSTGPFGYGLMAAPTLLHFIRFMNANQSIVSHTSITRMTIDEQWAEVAWSFSPLIVNRDQYTDLGMALVVARLRPFLGPDIDRVEVRIERSRPKDPSIFKELLTKRIRFGSPLNAIRIPVDLLENKNPSGDEKLFQLMDLQCKTSTIRKLETVAFPDELREFLASRIADPDITLESVASHFGLSARTLQRRLGSRNITLNGLRDEIRRDMAENLLLNTDTSLGEIAHRLGYSAGSAFTRSSIRWFGRNPSELRERNNSQAG